MRKTAIRAMAALAVALFLAFGSAGAQSIHRIDPSVRAAGMGLVSNGVFWEPMSASWKNPAVLAYQRGITYEHDDIEWVPSLGVEIASDRIAAGAWGVGLLLAGRPVDALGGTELTKSEDDPGMFEISEEEVNAFAFGVNAFELAGHLSERLGNSMPDIARYADASFGFAFNEIDVGGGDYPDFSAEASTKDYGLLARLTPYNSIDYPGTLPVLDEFLEPLVGGVRLDAAYGYSRQNYSEGETKVEGDFAPIKPPKFLHQGGTVRLSAGVPKSLETWLNEQGAGWLARGLVPLLSFGVGWDHMETTNSILLISGGEESPSRYKSKSSGWEITIANVLTLRRGNIDNDRNAYHGDTEGWGLGFRAADYGWLRYDHATVPFTLNEPDSERKSFTVCVDPLAIWRGIR